MYFQLRLLLGGISVTAHQFTYGSIELHVVTGGYLQLQRVTLSYTWLSSYIELHVVT